MGRMSAKYPRIIASGKLKVNTIRSQTLSKAKMENIREKGLCGDILCAFPEMLAFFVGWRKIMGIVRYNILRITHLGRGPNRLVIGITEAGPYSRPWLWNVDKLPIVSQKDHHFISGV